MNFQAIILWFGLKGLNVMLNLNMKEHLNPALTLRLQRFKIIQVVLENLLKSIIKYIIQKE